MTNHQILSLSNPTCTINFLIPARNSSPLTIHTEKPNFTYIWMQFGIVCELRILVTENFNRTLWSSIDAPSRQTPPVHREFQSKSLLPSSRKSKWPTLVSIEMCAKILPSDPWLPSSPNNEQQATHNTLVSPARALGREERSNAKP